MTNLVVNGDRVKHWLGLGAQPTERAKLLSSVSLTDPESCVNSQRNQPGKRTEREAEARGCKAAAGKSRY